jgi:hypothetical protein
MTKEALKLALETLEVWKGYMPHLWDKTDEQAITAIKEALAQPEQEYYAVNAVHKGEQCYVKAQPEQPKVRTGNCLRVGVCASEGHKIAPQRTWVGLTDEELNSVLPYCHNEFDLNEFREFAFAIGKLLKEKNT